VRDLSKIQGKIQVNIVSYALEMWAKMTGFFKILFFGQPDCFEIIICYNYFGGGYD